MERLSAVHAPILAQVGSNGRKSRFSQATAEARWPGGHVDAHEELHDV